MDAKFIEVTVGTYVVSLIMEMQAKLPEEVICLSGNHEDFLHRIDSEHGIAGWLTNGGDKTLDSYGVTSPAELPPGHLVWLRGLPTYHDDGQRLSVHAGINPKRPLHQQRREDLLWIRAPFLSSTADYDRLVVHGHTPTRGNTPEAHANRLTLDTGAVFGGPLSAAAFSSEQREPLDILQVHAHPPKQRL